MGFVPMTLVEKTALEGKTVALAVTGSIAAYKAVEVARLCIQQGLRVLPVMTASATRFVGPVTLSGICGQAVAQDMWDASFSGEMHVHLAREADAVLVVPATADVLARLAQGRADDLVTALALCSKGPVLAAPAMHPRMWEHPAVQRNVADLRAQGRVRLVGPVVGVVASGEEGQGRMAEPAAIVEALRGVFAPKDLAGLRLLVSAGPTVEDLDPVRFLGNRSSGKMGFALAAQAALRGAEVVLVAGPVNLPTPTGVRRIDVRSALEMRTALLDAAGPQLANVDAVVMTAAVADYRPAAMSATKIKKQGETASLALVKNPDILAEIGAQREGRTPVLVGFAVETGDQAALESYARGKLAAKRVDMVVANEAHVAFGADTNVAMLVDEQGAKPLPAMSKAELADALWTHVRERLEAVR
jgi:phosphopantothenoylcysteine decarboxylase/phosphopantothenate--cysteine ligase